MRRSAYFALLVSCWCLTVAPVFANDFKTGSLTIRHPWARPTVASMANGAVYLLVFADEKAKDRLVAAATPVAERVEFHTTTTDGGVARMRQLDAVDVPGVFKPGGTHLMLVGLKGALRVGEAFPLRLEFEKAGGIDVSVTVQKAPLTDHDDASPPAHSGH